MAAKAVESLHFQGIALHKNSRVGDPPIEVTDYRATRMHSADYDVARCLSVRSSVRPSVYYMPILSVNGYVISSKVFHLG